MLATQPVLQSMTPLARVSKIHRDATRREALERANKLKMTEIAVVDERDQGLVGYLKTVELVINDQASSMTKFLNPLLEISASESYGEAIMQLQSSGESMAKIVDQTGNCLGIITMDALMSPLLGGSLSSLHGPTTTTDFPVDIQAT